MCIVPFFLDLLRLTLNNSILSVYVNVLKMLASTYCSVFIKVAKGHEIRAFVTSHLAF